VTIDELGVDIHLVKENVVLSPNSRSTEKFMHGIKVLMAKNYIDNLSEEVRKGLRQKAVAGLWPTFAPIGYLNIVGEDGKKTIAPDPALAPAVRRLFESYATGKYSLKEVAKLARADGMIYRKSRNPIPTSTVHKILRKRAYCGAYDYNGVTYEGNCEAIVSKELWQPVQDVLDGRHAKRPKKRKHEFAFSGILTCGYCGCAMVGEIKKGRYVYYRCSGYKGKCQEPYTREEVLERAFAGLLRGISFTPDVLTWVTQALRESHDDKKRLHEAAIAKLQSEHRRLQDRIDAIYMGESTMIFSIGKPVSSVPSRAGSCGTSARTRMPIGVTSRKGSGCLNWRSAPTSCSKRSRQPKNESCWILYCRTADGSSADLRWTTGNPLT
jgi:hypothetical protein